MSSMSLAAFSLLLVHHVFCAAGQQQLKSEPLDRIAGLKQLESVMSITSVERPELASAIGLQAGELTGYAFDASYTDSTCTDFASAVIYPLNVCYGFIDKTVLNYMVTATSTSYVIKQYSDDACTTLVKTVKTGTYVAGACTSNSKLFVQSTIDVPTSKAVTYAR